MFCKNCGTEIETDEVFCHACGSKVVTTVTKDKVNSKPKKSEELTVTENVTLTSDESSVIKAFYHSAWDVSIAVFAIIGVILPVLSLFINGSAIDGGTFVVMFLLQLVVAAPFYIYGKKIKDADASNFSKNVRILNGMVIYAIVAPLGLAALGLGTSGWAFISAYFYYKAAKVTKAVRDKEDIGPYLAKTSEGAGGKAKKARNKRAFKYFLIFIGVLLALAVLSMYLS